ncbi:hypothetical protein [Phenylobacterium sp.]|uniref:hypothetical protein n=1 Tax=Phenylobacterium sp. TaxID=1871053 RepID=UPI0025DEE93A|nr:hypothetical protein [Phenylobacterium sp.]MBX3484340.1 hypothetical protein [Phenylobacterium sp.]MCW5759342.1 hypothetical protein [Phenylobacterium sp.]
MRITVRLAAPALVALLALAGCDQPKFRDKGAEPAAAAAVADAAEQAPKAREIPTRAEPVPAPPEWASAVMGKTLRAVYPKTGICKGNTDIVDAKFTGDPPGTRLLGWGWDTPKKVRVARVVLVDRTMSIVGAGAGGVERLDVTQALPEVTDKMSGWTAVTRLTAGPLDAYGVVGDGDAICPLGHIEF